MASCAGPIIFRPPYQSFLSPMSLPHPTSEDLHFMELAITWSKKGAASAVGGPFGAVIVRNGEVIGEGHNQVLAANDPTSHAEVVAIREACKKTGDFQLSGCTIYSSCEPCPMCLGAIYWARLDKVWFAATREDAAQVGFSDAHIYDELNRIPSSRQIPFYQMNREAARVVFMEWKDKPGKIIY